MCGRSWREVCQAVEGFDPGEVELVKQFPRDLDADQAPVRRLPGGGVDRIDVPVAAAVRASPVLSAAKSERRVRSAIWAMIELVERVAGRRGAFCT